MRKNRYVCMLLQLQLLLPRSTYSTCTYRYSRYHPFGEKNDYTAFPTIKRRRAA